MKTKTQLTESETQMFRRIEKFLIEKLLLEHYETRGALADTQANFEDKDMTVPAYLVTDIAAVTEEINILVNAFVPEAAAL